MRQVYSYRYTGGEDSLTHWRLDSAGSLVVGTAAVRCQRRQV